MDTHAVYRWSRGGQCATLWCAMVCYGVLWVWLWWCAVAVGVAVVVCCGGVLSWCAFLVCCGVVCCGVLWRAVVCYGVLWRAVMCCGLLWCSVLLLWVSTILRLGYGAVVRKL